MSALEWFQVGFLAVVVSVGMYGIIKAILSEKDE